MHQNTHQLRNPGGSVGFFGPLSVLPERWNQGIGSHLMEATIALFDHWGTAHAGLFTFAHSPKHHCLYQKFGFWPRFLTPVMTKTPVVRGPLPHAVGYTELPPAERTRALDACRELTASACEGLDLEREIHAVETQGLGEVLLLDDSSGLAGMAICHLGAGTEAGGRGCYVKFGLVRSGHGAKHWRQTRAQTTSSSGSTPGAARPMPPSWHAGTGPDWSGSACTAPTTKATAGLASGSSTTGARRLV